jgi:uncharacterized membrane protein (DUF4010 family)
MVSLARMTTLAVVVNPVLLRPLVAPIGAALAVLAMAAFLFHRQAALAPAQVDKSVFQNPLDLKLVFEFGALLAVIIVAVKLLGAAFGQAGVLSLAGISGFVDVDPITLSAAGAAGQSIALEAAAQAILLAAAANMVTKMAVTVLVGGLGFGWKLVLAGVLALIFGALALGIAGVP